MLCPLSKLSEIAVGVIDNRGDGGAVTVRLTVTFCGLLELPDWPLIRTVPVYEPAVRFLASICSVAAVGAVPPVGWILSQVAPWVTVEVHVRVPVPEFVI